MSKSLSGYVDDGRAAPLAGVSAIVTVVGSGAVVTSGITDADGHWQFDGLADGSEYFVNVVDIDGNAVVRGPWSGEVRDVWVRDRLAMSPTGAAQFVGLHTAVDGKPLVLDPNPLNGLTWGPTGLFSASGGLTQSAADLRYVNVDGDTMTGQLTIDGGSNNKAFLAYDQIQLQTTGYDVPLTLRTHAGGEIQFANNNVVVGVGTTPGYHLTIYPELRVDGPIYAEYPVKRVGLSPDALNTLEWRANGFWSAGGLTQAAADLRYEPIDTMYTKAESDARYTQGGITQAAADLRYEPIDTMYTKAEDDARFVNLAGGSVMTGLLGPTTTNARDLGTTTLRWRALYGMTADLSTSLTIASKAVGVSATGGNTLTWNSDGFYVAAGAVTDIWVNTTGDTMTGALTLRLTGASNQAISLGQTGDAWSRWDTDASGVMKWGSGAVAPDTYLYRSGVATLTINASGLPDTTNARDLGSTSLRWRKLWGVDADLSGGLNVTGNVTLGQDLTLSAGRLYITQANAGLEFGAMGVSNTPFFDFHSGAVAVDFDARLLASGGTGVNAGGTLQVQAATLALTGAQTIVGDLTHGSASRAVFANVVMDDKIVLSTGNTIGLRSGIVAYFAQNGTDKHAFFTGGVERASISGTSMTLTGALIQSGGFGYLGNYNAGAPLYPVANQGMAVAWNYNSGSRDMALFNTDTAATMGFSWNQLTGASTATSLMRLNSDGTLRAVALQVNTRPVIMAGCRVYHSVAQTITTATTTVLAFNNERFDSDAFHDTVTNNSRLTVPTGLAGKYLIWATVEWAPVADATMRLIGLQLNVGTQIARVGGPAVNNASFGTTQNVSCVYDLAVGDYVQVIVFHARGSNLDVGTTANYSPEFGMQRIG